MRIEMSTINWLEGEAVPSRFFFSKALDNFLSASKFSYLDVQPTQDFPSRVIVAVTDIGIHVLSYQDLEEVWRLDYPPEVVSSTPTAYLETCLQGQGVAPLNPTEWYLAGSVESPSELSWSPASIDKGPTTLVVGPLVIDFQRQELLALVSETTPAPAGGRVLVLDGPGFGNVAAQIDLGLGQYRWDTVFVASDSTYEWVFYPPSWGVLRKNLRTGGPWELLTAHDPEDIHDSLRGPISGPFVPFESVGSSPAFSFIAYIKDDAMHVAVLKHDRNLRDEARGSLPPQPDKWGGLVLEVVSRSIPRIQQDLTHIYFNTHNAVFRVEKASGIPTTLNYVVGEDLPYDALIQGSLPVGLIESMALSGEYLVLCINQSAQFTEYLANVPPVRFVQVVMDKEGKNILYMRSSLERMGPVLPSDFVAGTEVNPGLTKSPPPGQGP